MMIQTESYQDCFLGAVTRVRAECGVCAAAARLPSLLSTPGNPPTTPTPLLGQMLQTRGMIKIHSYMYLAFENTLFFHLPSPSKSLIKWCIGVPGPFFGGANNFFLPKLNPVLPKNILSGGSNSPILFCQADAPFFCVTLFCRSKHWVKLLNDDSKTGKNGRKIGKCMYGRNQTKMA